MWKFVFMIFVAGRFSIIASQLLIDTKNKKEYKIRETKKVIEFYAAPGSN